MLGETRLSQILSKMLEDTSVYVQEKAELMTPKLNQAFRELGEEIGKAMWKDWERICKLFRKLVGKE